MGNIKDELLAIKELLESKNKKVRSQYDTTFTDILLDNDIDSVYS